MTRSEAKTLTFDQNGRIESTYAADEAHHAGSVSENVQYLTQENYYKIAWLQIDRLQKLAELMDETAQTRSLDEADRLQLYALEVRESAHAMRAVIRRLRETMA